MILSSNAQKIINILRQSRGRYQNVDFTPKVADTVAVLSDGSVCPIHRGQPNMYCFKIVANVLKLTKSPVPTPLEKGSMVNINSSVKEFNRKSEVKIINIGKLMSSGYTFSLI